jgi:hypothetical protein
MLPTDAAQALIRGLISEGRTVTDTLSRHTAAVAAERAGLLLRSLNLTEFNGLMDNRVLTAGQVTATMRLKALFPKTNHSGRIATRLGTGVIGTVAAAARYRGFGRWCSAGPSFRRCQNLRSVNDFWT